VSKKFAMQVLPQEGQSIAMENDILTVSRVTHHLPRAAPPYVSVECLCGMGSIVSVLNDHRTVPDTDGGWRIEGSTKKAQEILRARLEK